MWPCCTSDSHSAETIPRVSDRPDDHAHSCHCCSAIIGKLSLQTCTNMHKYINTPSVCHLFPQKRTRLIQIPDVDFCCWSNCMHTRLKRADVTSPSTTNSFSASLVSLVCETTGAVYTHCCEEKGLWVTGLLHNRKVEHTHNSQACLGVCVRGKNYQEAGTKTCLRCYCYLNVWQPVQMSLFP